jgi:hypothetical protein
MRPKHTETRRKAKAAGFRSGLEQVIDQQLRKKKVEYKYEPKDQKVTYVPKVRTYLPDFVLTNGVILEVKGRLTSADRVKHLLIKAQHPELDIRFVFQVDNKISRVSTTRYSDWCDKHGFQYCFIDIPEEWFND